MSYSKPNPSYLLKLVHSKNGIFSKAVKAELTDCVFHTSSIVSASGVFCARVASNYVKLGRKSKETMNKSGQFS